MDWQKTVIPTSEHSESIWCPHCGEEFGIESKVEAEREVQAEVSFKAGQDARDCEWDEWKDKYLPQVIRDSRKEVVEWIDKHHEWGFSDNPKTMNYDKVLLVSQLEWQTFLKEWGL